MDGVPRGERKKPKKEGKTAKNGLFRDEKGIFHERGSTPPAKRVGVNDYPAPRE